MSTVFKIFGFLGAIGITLRLAVFQLGFWSNFFVVFSGVSLAVAIYAALRLRDAEKIRATSDAALLTSQTANNGSIGAASGAGSDGGADSD